LSTVVTLSKDELWKNQVVKVHMHIYNRDNFFRVHSCHTFKWWIMKNSSKSLYNGVNYKRICNSELDLFATVHMQLSLQNEKFDIRIFWLMWYLLSILAWKSYFSVTKKEFIIYIVRIIYPSA
jgi:hypothetical protein